jgi:TolA-binding protein
MARLPIIALALAALGAGCFTQSEGEALRRDLERLKRELEDKAKQAERDRAKLQKVMEQATALLTRNSADVGAQVERIQAKVDKVAGEVETRNKRVDELAQKLGELQAKVDVKLESLASGSKPTPTPTDKDELFKQAQSKLAAGDQLEARRLAREFITRFPSDPRLDRAQMLLGDSYYTEQKFPNAIVEYRKVIEQYKHSAMLPDALAKIGMSFYQLKYCREAADFFNELLKKHKRHAQAAQAKKVLALIKRFRHNRSVCNP